MGLKSEPVHGVKSVLRQQFPDAFFHVEALDHVQRNPALRACELDRDVTSAGVDGNVLLMQTMATTLEQAVRSVERALRSVTRAAHVVVVVFDEPDLLTLAKREEQYRRDVRDSSEPAAVTPTDGDRYELATLLRISAAEGLQSLFRYRPARVRLFDEIVVRVACNLAKDASLCANVYFDGVDPRGALRVVDAVREPTLIRADRLCAIRCGAASAEPDVDEIELRHAPTGEGDIKLVLVEQRLELSETHRSRLHMTVTVDTDSIPISLVHRSARLHDPLYADTMKSVLCMRNTGKNASGFTCIDVSVLYNRLQGTMWSCPPDERISRDLQRAAITLLVAGWALCGCDFVELKGVRATEVHNVLPGMLVDPRYDGLLSRVGVAYTGMRCAEEVIVHFAPVLRSLVELCHAMRRNEKRVQKKTLEAMQCADDVVFKRAAWVAAYWNKIEFTDNLDLFGFGPHVPEVSPDLCGKRATRE